MHRRVVKEQALAEGVSIAARIRADFVWASGLVKLAELRGYGRSALIGFDRVRPPQLGKFQPRRHLDASPASFDRLIRAFKRWRVDIVSIDDACARLADKTSHRFVSLSFNGAYHNVVTSARPVLDRHDVPYTVYIPSAFPDGIAQPWWLALEAVIARHARISIVIDDKDSFFTADSAFAKQQLYDRLHGWMSGLSPAALTHAINDLCARYDVDMTALATEVSITWDHVTVLAADPRVTIGSASVNYSVLTSLNDEAARRDIAMGRAVLETALRRPVRHFAFPFGDATSFDQKHIEMARAAGFACAVTAVPGTLDPNENAMHGLPRLIWNDGMTLRGLRAGLAGY